MKSTIQKAFLEERSSRLFKTLKEAKSQKYAYVYRVWQNSAGRTIGRTLVWAYGEQVCTVKRADEIIAKGIPENE